MTAGGGLEWVVTIRSQYEPFVTRNTSKVADAFVHCQQLGYLIGTGSTHRDSSMVHYEDLTESENKCQFAADGALADTVQKSTVHGFSDRADGQETAHEDNPESLYG